MKCPNCGTTNGLTNKYCRGCGTQLDVLVSRGSEDTAAVARADEVSLGEELFAVHELFESGDLDAALAKSEQLAAENPGSESAHAIVALVCERKAEQELSEGDAERGHDLLKRAIECYEAIIDLNPDSAADRGKLASLRMKHTGHAAAAPNAGLRLDFAEALRAVPKPVLAGFGAFLVVLALVIVFTGRPDKPPKPTHAGKPPDKAIVSVAQTTPSEPGQSVYTFPQAANPSPTVPIRKAPTPASDSSYAEVRPMKLPKIDQELTLVPEPKPSPKKSAAEPAKQPPKPAETASSPSGDTLYAQAIRLHEQGKVSEAIGAANQAIVLYNADIDAGRRVEAARRGISNATKQISLWQQSTNGASE